jgi:hypothetical protein
MKCGRTHCLRPHDGWWNKYTEKNYCYECAQMINESSVQSGLGKICARQEPAKEQAND